DLDDAVERAAPGLDERPDRGEDRARLSLAVAAVFHAALRVVGDLPGREEQRLRARHLDALAVARRIVHAGRPVLLDLRHARLLSPPDHMSLSGSSPRSARSRGARVAAGEAGRERQGLRPAALITLRAPAAPPPGPSSHAPARSARRGRGASVGSTAGPPGRRSRSARSRRRRRGPAPARSFGDTGARAPAGRPGTSPRPGSRTAPSA